MAKLTQNNHGGGTSGKYGEDQKYIQGFGGKTCRKETCLKTQA
jgi:hypothetical protein